MRTVEKKLAEAQSHKFWGNYKVSNFILKCLKYNLFISYLNNLNLEWFKSQKSKS